MGWSVAWWLVGVLVGAATVWVIGRWKRDTSERARVEAALIDSRARTRAADEFRRDQDLILSSMQDGVVLFDAEGATRYVNDALPGHLGARPAEIRSLLPLALRHAAETAAREGDTVSIVVEVGSPSRWLRILAAPAGGDGSVLVVVRDVTRARLADDIRRDFVANASHELKSPAASIQAGAETIQVAANEDPEAVPRFALQLEREALRLSRIVADLLDLSRLEGGSELSERVRLDAIVLEEGRRSRDEARAAGLTLSVHAPEEAPVRGSARDLSLMVRNLVDNAIRYAGRNGTVRVTTAVESDLITLEVADDGVGIPTKDLPRIFERFYRVDRARSRETGGTGLGLAIVRHVAENHGGQVRVESELGRGTTFRVELPRD
jgi:two-component system sensor histidine kinase SenX3